MSKIMNMNAERIEEYIKNHLADATLDGLADEIGYSKVYIDAYVRSVMNISFPQLLRKMRSKYSKKLLEETDFSVQETTELTAYKNEN